MRRGGFAAVTGTTIRSIWNWTGVAMNPPMMGRVRARKLVLAPTWVTFNVLRDAQ
jgi:hypothetical protein